MQQKKTTVLALLALSLSILASAWWGLPGLFAPGLLALNRSVAGVSVHEVHAAGHRLRVLSGGTGEPVVLLHGIFAEKDHWVDFARPLTGRWRVVAPDLPGFGQSDRHEDQPYDYGTQVDRLKAFLDAQGLDRVHLAGNSMGGTLAVLFAQRHPQRVASVALIGSPHGIRTPLPSDMDLLIDRGEAPLVARTEKEFDRMMDLVFTRRPWLPHPILHASRTAALAQAGSNLRLWEEQRRDRWLLDARIGALAAPALVLWGDADRVFHASGADVLRARLPAARVHLLPGIGHLPHMEAPALAAHAYAQFLEELTARPGPLAARP